jgi:DNA-binding MarR family transcriptional regulator
MTDSPKVGLPADGRDHLAALTDEGLLSLETLQLYVSAVILVREIELAMDEIFKELSVSNREFEALVSIYHWGDKYQNPRSLASLLGMSGAGVTSLVDRMVTQGYLERYPDPSDGRAILLVLTAEGERVVDSGLRMQVHWLNENLKAALPKEKALKLSALLRQAVSHIRPDYEPPRARDSN